ncbi:MAG: hypothetical protein ACI9OD_003293 [Limisphaerales bacterium]
MEEGFGKEVVNALKAAMALLGLALFGRRAALELRLMRLAQADVPTEEFIEWVRFRNDDLGRILKSLWRAERLRIGRRC